MNLRTCWPAIHPSAVEVRKRVAAHLESLVARKPQAAEEAPKKKRELQRKASR